MAENVLTIAYENGVNLFDTAEVYASGKYVWLFRPWLFAGLLPPFCLRLK